MELEKLQRKERMVEGYQPCSQNRQLVMVGVELELRRIWSQCVRQFFPPRLIFANRFQPTPQIVWYHLSPPPPPCPPEKIINWSWCLIGTLWILNLGKACLSLSNFCWVHFILLEVGRCEDDCGFKDDNFIVTFAKVFTQFCLGIGPLV